MCISQQGSLCVFVHACTVFTHIAIITQAVAALQHPYVCLLLATALKAHVQALSAVSVMGLSCVPCLWVYMSFTGGRGGTEHKGKQQQEDHRQNGMSGPACLALTSQLEGTPKHWHHNCCNLIVVITFVMRSGHA